MTFVSIRDFRNKTTSIRKSLSIEHEIVVTSNGGPFAILVTGNKRHFPAKARHGVMILAPGEFLEFLRGLS